MALGYFFLVSFFELSCPQTILIFWTNPISQLPSELLYLLNWICIWIALRLFISCFPPVYFESSREPKDWFGCCSRRLDAGSRGSGAPGARDAVAPHCVAHSNHELRRPRAHAGLRQGGRGENEQSFAEVQSSRRTRNCDKHRETLCEHERHMWWQTRPLASEVTACMWVLGHGTLDGNRWWCCGEPSRRRRAGRRGSDQGPHRRWRQRCRRRERRRWLRHAAVRRVRLSRRAFSPPHVSWWQPSWLLRVPLPRARRRRWCELLNYVRFRFGLLKLNKTNWQLVRKQNKKKKKVHRMLTDTCAA